MNRESPARDAESFAKRRAIERRLSKKGQSESTGQGSAKKTTPTLIRTTLKCSAFNGGVFGLATLIFNAIILPMVQWVISFVMADQERVDDLWAVAHPLLHLSFLILWIFPFYILGKIVNTLLFQDIADFAFASSQGRPAMFSSVSVMLADSIFTFIVESIFFVQGFLSGWLPIRILAVALVFVHTCLLHSLYCFEYKWFAQGLELHKRLHYIEANWPYFLGFGLPLCVLTSLPGDMVVSGCLFSILFPFFIVSAHQANVVPAKIETPLAIFKPTMTISNLLLTRVSYYAAADSPSSSAAARGQRSGRTSASSRVSRSSMVR